MNKAQLIEEVSNKTGLTKKNVGNVVNTVVETITNTLQEEKRVILVGFGTFRIIEKKARRGRNPQTGEELQIPSKRVPKFLPGKDLRKKVG